MGKLSTIIIAAIIIIAIYLMADYNKKNTSIPCAIELVKIAENEPLQYVSDSCIGSVTNGFCVATQPKYIISDYQIGVPLKSEGFCRIGSVGGKTPPIFS